MLGLVSASLGTFKQGECVNIKTILNASDVNISTVSLPNGTITVSNRAMTRTSQTFTYLFCNTTELGVYTYDYFDEEGNVYVNTFEITTSGRSANSYEGLGIILIWIFAYVFIFIIFIYGNRVPYIKFMGYAMLVINGLIGLWVIETPIAWITLGGSLFIMSIKLYWFMEKEWYNG